VFKIFLIGVTGDRLSGQQADALCKCKAVFAHSRYLNLARQYTVAETIFSPISPIETALENMAKAVECGDIAVLASGDPLFSGIGKRLCELFTGDAVEILPGLSSIQLLSSIAKTNWDDARFLSLHARNQWYPGMILRHKKIFVLTDKSNTPAVIAEKLLDYLQLIEAEDFSGNIRVWIGEKLGTPTARVTTTSLHELCHMSFSDPNLALFCNSFDKQPKMPLFGLKEVEIDHLRGMITKDEIRAVAIHNLRMEPGCVLWDIGAGSGSIGIEASRITPNAMVYAIEKEPAQQQKLLANIRQFKAFNIIPVPAPAPEGLSGLPDPDRVFIGGSGGRLSEIIDTVALRLTHGIVVINCVTDRCRQAAPELLLSKGFRVSAVEVRIKRSDKFYDNEITKNFKELNPVTVVAGSR